MGICATLPQNLVGGGWGVGCGGQSAVKVTENENEEKKHKYDKKMSWKKKKNLVTLVLGGFDH